MASTTPTEVWITRNGDPRGLNLTEAELYPTAKAHTWNAFAGVAIELEGYNDARVIDPYSGDTLYIPDLGPDLDLASILRKAADAAEATGFGKTQD